MVRAFTVLLILLLSAMSVSAESAAAAPMGAICDHSSSGSCDCPQGPERCPDMMLAGAACQSCCPAILPQSLDINVREGTGTTAIRAPANGLLTRIVAPEPPPPRTV
ncbi:hypothetical protein [Sphingomonas sp.]|uniref:hypothetical protein n=1 Tax=Sphingomonas sp. TaxID=28214 RepID=UPI003D6CC0DB